MLLLFRNFILKYVGLNIASSSCVISHPIRCNVIKWWVGESISFPARFSDSGYFIAVHAITHSTHWRNKHADLMTSFQWTWLLCSRLILNLCILKSETGIFRILFQTIPPLLILLFSVNCRCCTKRSTGPNQLNPSFLITKLTGSNLSNPLQFHMLSIKVDLDQTEFTSR